MPPEVAAPEAATPPLNGGGELTETFKVSKKKEKGEKKCEPKATPSREEFDSLGKELASLRKTMEGIGQSAVQQVAGLYQTHHRQQLDDIKKRADGIVELLGQIEPFYRMFAPHAALFSAIIQIVQDEQGNSLSLLDILQKIVAEKKAAEAAKVDCAKILAEIKSAKVDIVAMVKALPTLKDDGGIEI